MTTPTPPEGKFVSSDDAVARFEGTFPPGRVPWLKFRIFDVENALMGDVPSLRKPLPDIIEASAAAGDPDRVERVKQLVVDKVLGLYRNPDGATQVSQTMEQDTTSRSYGFYQDPTRGRIAFTAQELDRVKLHRKRRRRITTMPVAPWGIGCL